MAPSSGHLLVPKLRKIFEIAISKTVSTIQSKLPLASPLVVLEAVPVRSSRVLQPIANLQRARTLQSRSFSTYINRVITSTARQLDRASTPAARVSNSYSRVSRSVSRVPIAPFASSLRPNLTGGTLLRSSGGYSLGGSTRAFSHIPAAQAQVFHNVSAGVRAFCLQGYKARYDGINRCTGEKQYVAVSKTHHEASRLMRAAVSTSDERGTILEFNIAPTVTAVPSFDTMATLLGDDAPAVGLDAEILKPLASDFARSLSNLSAVYADLSRLSALGALPISRPAPHLLAVRFPGCDRQIVEALCDELGITRCVVREDPSWRADKDVEMALLFPYAPCDNASSERHDGQYISEYFEQLQRPSMHRNLAELPSAVAPCQSQTPDWNIVPGGSMLGDSRSATDSGTKFSNLPPYADVLNSVEYSEDERLSSLVDISGPSNSTTQSNDWQPLLRSDGVRLAPRLGDRGFTESNIVTDMQGIYEYLAQVDARARSRERH